MFDIEPCPVLQAATRDVYPESIRCAAAITFLACRWSTCSPAALMCCGCYFSYQKVAQVCGRETAAVLLDDVGWVWLQVLCLSDA